MRSSFGVLIRGVGGNPRSVARAGWSVLRSRAGAYALAAVFAVAAGIALVGLTTSADANIALRYTLLSIAGVILGGGEFTGGRVSPIGAVIGALTLTLAGSFLSFLRLSPDWQIGAQGAILIIVLALRLVLTPAGGSGREATRMMLARARPGSGPSSPPSRSGWRPSLVTGGREHGGAGAGGADLCGLLGAGRHRADVRHHPRPRQHRPVGAGDDDAGGHASR